MIIEMDESEMVELFGAGTKLSSCGGQYLLNGKIFTLEGYDWWSKNFCTNARYGYTYRLHLRQIVVKPKSPQEVAAEEAVQKAESALKAAKEVLNKVKEN